MMEAMVVMEKPTIKYCMLYTLSVINKKAKLKQSRIPYNFCYRTSEGEETM